MQSDGKHAARKSARIICLLENCKVVYSCTWRLQLLKRFSKLSQASLNSDLAHVTLFLLLDFLTNCQGSCLCSIVMWILWQKEKHAGLAYSQVWKLGRWNNEKGQMIKWSSSDGSFGSCCNKRQIIKLSSSSRSFLALAGHARENSNNNTDLRLNNKDRSHTINRNEGPSQRGSKLLNVFNIVKYGFNIQRL